MRRGHVQGISIPSPTFLLIQLSHTRCPTECKLTRADASWSCAVKLHFHTDVHGDSVPLRVENFGDAISDKAEVEERIRRAQRAILNPSTSPSVFLGGVEVEENESSFSRNYISLEISGRELEDLSFVDLPGLIASVGHNGREEDIKLVRDLVISYIERESCVILLTVACESRCQISLWKTLFTSLYSLQPISRIRARTTLRSSTIRKANVPWVSHFSYGLKLTSDLSTPQGSSLNLIAFLEMRRNLGFD